MDVYFSQKITIMSPFDQNTNNINKFRLQICLSFLRFVLGVHCVDKLTDFSTIFWIRICEVFDSSFLKHSHLRWNSGMK